MYEVLRWDYFFYPFLVKLVGNGVTPLLCLHSPFNAMQPVQICFRLRSTGLSFFLHSNVIIIMIIKKEKKNHALSELRPQVLLLLLVLHLKHVERKPEFISSDFIKWVDSLITNLGLNFTL